MFFNTNNKISELSYKIPAVVIVLTAIGLFSLYSVSQHQGGDFFHSAFSKQLIFIIPSIIGFLLILFIPRHIIHNYSYALYVFAVIGVAIPYLGSHIAGTYRWINIGGIGFQPSEFAKWILILALARYLSDHNIEMRRITSVVIPFGIALIPTAIVLKQPDLGSAVIMIVPVMTMLYWAGSRPFHLFIIVAPLLSIITAFHTIPFTIWAVILASVIFFSRSRLLLGLSLFFTNIFLGLLWPVIWNSLRSYQQNRILTLFKPDLDPLGAAYQIIQSKTAIGSGGFIGKGWGMGTQTHLKFLPIQESDFILSVIGEELGFISIMVIFLCFAYIILKILKMAYDSNDRYFSLVLVGVSTILLSHVFVNSAMTVGLIPVKGLPLPFISAGGSFLVSCYMMIGLILNIGNSSRS